MKLLLRRYILYSFLLLSDQSLKMNATELFARQLMKMCPDTLGLLNQNSQIKFLDDGRLLIDNGHNARIFNKGFCLEYFSDRTGESLSLSAFLCQSSKPDQTYDSFLPQKVSEENNVTGTMSYFNVLLVKIC